jgi:3-oxoacyl-[acyl-carrier protein] reductase
MNKNVLITGASRGIGKAAAIAFAKKGYGVCVNYYSSETEAFELVKSLNKQGCCTAAYKADISDFNEVKSMVEKCESDFSHIDILINNAGIAQQKLFTDLTVEDWHRMMSVDLDGVFNCTRLVLPKMIARHSGKIINVSSIWGICGGSCEVHYSAAKSAVIGLTKALAKEVGPSNIQVNAVAPGCIETEMNSHLTEDDKQVLCEDTPLCRFGTPDDIANAMLFLASPSADFITGQVLSPNGGFVI